MRKYIAATALALAIGGVAVTTTTASAYTVQPGDTLSAIAAQHNTSVAVLAQANGIANPDVLNVGQHVNVGVSAPKARTATVAPKAPTAPKYVAPKAATPEPVVQAPAASGGGAKDEIMRRESGGNPNAVNSSSGAVGLFQCLPSSHSDCPAAGDSAGQNAWADKYVAERYGSWDSALAHHNANGWY